MMTGGFLSNRMATPLTKHELKHAFKHKSRNIVTNTTQLSHNDPTSELEATKTIEDNRRKAASVQSNRIKR